MRESLTELLEFVVRFIKRAVIWRIEKLSLFQLIKAHKKVRKEQKPIARNRRHFPPVINCQRHLIFKMADKNNRSQEKRVPYDVLNNLSSVVCFTKKKGRKNIFREDFRYLPGRAADSNKTGRGCK